MKNIDIWLFRLFILITAGLMVLSWLLPWWTCNINSQYEAIRNAVTIHPWGLSNNLGYFTLYIEDAPMPAWFAPFMWTYLGLCLVALIFSIFIKGKSIKLGKFNFSMSAFIVGIVGFSYVVVAAAAAILAAIRTGDFWGVKLVGTTYFVAAEFAEGYAHTMLLPGYWLACATGPIMIVIALLWNRKTKTNVN